MTPSPPAPTAYDGKLVVITGGLGFIGSNLAHALARDTRAEIRIVDSLHPRCGADRRNLDGLARSVETHVADLADTARLEPVVEGASFVFNLAGQVSHIDSMELPLQDLDCNARAHLSLLETCRRRAPRARVVYAGTRQIYGRPLRLPVDESHPITPTDINGINKFAGESYHRIYHQAYGLETCALRLTNTYGPRQMIRHARQGFMGWFIRTILRGEEVAIFGDGLQLRDLNYVDCAVDAFMRAGASPKAPGRVYNLGSEPVTLRQIVELMIEIAGRGSYRIEPFPESRRRIDIGSVHSDYSRICREIGWRPCITLRDGLSRTFEFFERNRADYLESAHA